jgi:uncharacterized protein
MLPAASERAADGRLRALELIGRAGRRLVIGEPLADLRVPLAQLIWCRRVERGGILGGPAEQQHVRHVLTCTRNVERSGRQLDDRACENEGRGAVKERAARVRADAMSLLDWRRRVAALYAEVRAAGDARDGHRIWQEGRNRLLGSHPQSPIPADRRAEFTSVPVAGYDPAFRFSARVDTEVAPARLEVATGTDGVVPFERAGVVHLDDVGDLDVWWLAGYGGGIFVPVKDTRSDAATYPGGRYVIDSAKGADLGGRDGHLVIDLNFAYNPSCAYDPAWACPLAPPGNTLSLPVNAGEFYQP